MAVLGRRGAAPRRHRDDDSGSHLPHDRRRCAGRRADILPRRARVAQVVVFACVSTLLLFAVRPWAKRRLAAATPQMKTNVEALIGRSAVTITPVDREGGRVRLGGEEWSARLAPAVQGGVTRLEAGVSVTVAQIDGAVAVVAPVTTSTAAPAS